MSRSARSSPMLPIMTTWATRCWRWHGRTSGPRLSAYLRRDADGRADARLPARAQRPAAEGVRPAVLRAAAARRARPRSPSPSSSTTSTARAGPSACTRPSTPRPWRRPGSTRRYGAYVDEVLGALPGAAQRDVAVRPATAGCAARPWGTSPRSRRPARCRRARSPPGIERLGLAGAVAAYFHEHVEADAVHEQVAARDICGACVADDPTRCAATCSSAPRACLHLDGALRRRAAGAVEPAGGLDDRRRVVSEVRVRVLPRRSDARPRRPDGGGRRGRRAPGDPSGRGGVRLREVRPASRGATARTRWSSHA